MWRFNIIVVKSIVFLLTGKCLDSKTSTDNKTYICKEECSNINKLLNRLSDIATSIPASEEVQSSKQCLCATTSHILRVLKTGGKSLKRKRENEDDSQTIVIDDDLTPIFIDYKWDSITSDLDGFTKGMNACLCWTLSWLFCFFHRLSCNHEQDHRHCWYHLGETCILCLSWCCSCSISLISDSSGLLPDASLVFSGADAIELCKWCNCS